MVGPSVVVGGPVVGVVDFVVVVGPSVVVGGTVVGVVDFVVVVVVVGAVVVRHTSQQTLIL